MLPSNACPDCSAAALAELPDILPGLCCVPEELPSQLPEISAARILRPPRRLHQPAHSQWRPMIAPRRCAKPSRCDAPTRCRRRLFSLAPTIYSPSLTSRTAGLAACTAVSRVCFIARASHCTPRPAFAAHAWPAERRTTARRRAHASCAARVRTAGERERSGGGAEECRGRLAAFSCECSACADHVALRSRRCSAWRDNLLQLHGPVCVLRRSERLRVRPRLRRSVPRCWGERRTLPKRAGLQRRACCCAGHKRSVLECVPGTPWRLLL